MKCRYCELYQESSVRMNGGRFCGNAQAFVEKESSICDYFRLGNSFWCDKTDCWLDVPMCTARRNRGCEECTRCRQKKDLMELRRFLGRRAPKENNQPQLAIKKKLIRRKAA
jgi:hypothetical protein